MFYDKLYYTDIPEHAAFLMALGQVLDSFYWARTACVFVFEDEVKCQKVIAGILSGKTRIKATALTEALKTINSVINLKLQL